MVQQARRIRAGCSIGRRFMRKFLTLFALTASFALGACNTVKGVGEDVKSVGEAGDKAI
jgi:entericidin B